MIFKCLGGYNMDKFRSLIGDLGQLSQSCLEHGGRKCK